MTPALVDHVDFLEVDAFPTIGEVDPRTLYALRLSNNTTRLTHGLHRFPAKFIPQVPEWAIREFASDDATVVWDPFMGSGTSLIEAIAAGRQGVGTDIDPLARLITAAKVSPPSSKALRRATSALTDVWESTPDPVPPMPDIGAFEHWFTAEAWRELDGLLCAIDKVATSRALRYFLLAVFSSIIRRVSNADDQSQKTYVSGSNPKSPAPVHETFFRALERAISGVVALEELPNKGRARISRGDAISTPLGDSSVDLVVTSPPYLDSVDYMYNFMLEYFWLGPRFGISTRKSFNTLRRQVVGAKNPEEKAHILPAGLDDLVYFNGMSRARRAAAETYFTLMRKHFAEAARVTRVGGHYVLVIGNSQTVGGVVPVHDCLIRLAHDAGFELVSYFAYRVRRHYMKFPRRGRGGIIVLDWVLALQRKKRPSPTPPARLPLPWLTLHPTAVAN